MQKRILQCSVSIVAHELVFLVLGNYAEMRLGKKMYYGNETKTKNSGMLMSTRDAMQVN